MRNFIPIADFEKLVSYSNKMALYYFCPVFLLGSSLEHSHYNDVDVFIVLPDRYFNLRYGVNDYMTRLSRDMEKRWLMGCEATGLNLDLKILPKTAFIKKYSDQQMIRLDNLNF